MEVRELLRGRRTACGADDDLESVAVTLRGSRDGRIAIVSDLRSMRFLAELRLCDIESAVGECPESVYELRAADLAREASVCRLRDTPEAALAVMRACASRTLYVVDEDDRFQGYITYEDVYRHSDAVARAENRRSAPPLAGRG